MQRSRRGLRCFLRTVRTTDPGQRPIAGRTGQNAGRKNREKRRTASGHGRAISSLLSAGDCGHGQRRRDAERRKAAATAPDRSFRRTSGTNAHRQNHAEIKRENHGAGHRSQRATRARDASCGGGQQGPVRLHRRDRAGHRRCRCGRTYGAGREGGRDRQLRGLYERRPGRGGRDRGGPAQSSRRGEPGRRGPRAGSRADPHIDGLRLPGGRVRPTPRTTRPIRREPTDARSWPANGR